MIDHILRAAFAVACILVLAGCGGEDKKSRSTGNAPPEARAGSDQRVQEGTGVTLDGSGSTDSDGTIVSYEWSQVSGVPTVVLSGAHTVRTTFQAPDVTADTVLEFELLVRDDDGATDTDRIRVTVRDVPAPNAAPEARAGSDQRVAEGEVVTLDGSGSLDSDGRIVSYTWSQVSGVPSVFLSGDDTARATFQAPEVSAGTVLEFELLVGDDDGATDTDRIRVTVRDVPAPNTAPEARTGSDQGVQEGTGVTLDGSGSTDSDGTIVSYEWSQVSGTPSVLLSGADTVRTTFQAPDVTADTVLEFELLVRDDDGATDTDRIRVTVRDVPAPNAAPEARTGSDQRVAEGEVVTLDGSGSLDSDGRIVSYTWSQVSGAPSVFLSGDDTARATFQAPEVSADTVLEFELLVRDDDGATDVDRVRIAVTDLAPPPGILVSEVSGNTAFLGAAAEFEVWLNSPPSSDVTIPVVSSDESEGVPETAQVVFTSNNWDQPQLIIIRGANPNVVNGEQNYVIRLGPSRSTDPRYNRIEIADIEMKGISLAIEIPFPPDAFFADVEGSLQPVALYTGDGKLSFSLAPDAPTGMVIDPEYGRITWTPGSNDAGNFYRVGVSVSDGSRSAHVSFVVSVVQPSPLQTEIVVGRLTVTDAATDLQGLSITAPDLDTNSAQQALLGARISLVTGASVRALPDYVTPVSDFFVVRQPLEHTAVFSFPLRDLPPGIDGRDVVLFGLDEVTDSDEPIWSPFVLDLNFEWSAGALVLSMSLEGPQGLYVFGVVNDSSSGEIEPPRAGMLRGTRIAEQVEVVVSQAAGITCRPRVVTTTATNVRRYTDQTCTHETRPRSAIRVLRFARTATGTRWGGVRIEQLAQWLFAAMDGFDRLRMGYDQDIIVYIQKLKPGLLGYVSPRQRRRVLFLTSRKPKLITTMKGTAVHEYFHHAQGHKRTKVQFRVPTDGGLLIDQGGARGKWIIEGTARWFEDYIFDNDDTYVAKERRGLKILSVGLNAVPNKGKKETRPYQRFAFFKHLFGNECSIHDVRRLLTVAKGDPSGIGRATDLSCLSTATGRSEVLLYYQYATAFRKQIRLLDAVNENNVFRFDGEPRVLKSGMGGLGGSTQGRLTGKLAKFTVPPMGAKSFWIRGVGTIPEKQMAELRANVEGDVRVSYVGGATFPGRRGGVDYYPAIDGARGYGRLGPEDDDHEHVWYTQGSYSRPTPMAHRLGGGGMTLRDLFVIVVNPSTTNAAELKDIELWLKPDDCGVVNGDFQTGSLEGWTVTDHWELGHGTVSADSGWLRNSRDTTVSQRICVPMAGGTLKFRWRSFVKVQRDLSDAGESACVWTGNRGEPRTYLGGQAYVGRRKHFPWWRWDDNGRATFFTPGRTYESAACRERLKLLHFGDVEYELRLYNTLLGIEVENERDIHDSGWREFEIDLGPYKGLDTQLNFQLGGYNPVSVLSIRGDLHKVAWSDSFWETFTELDDIRIE